MTMIDEKAARESHVTMRSRRPLDQEIEVVMENIAVGLYQAGRPALKEDTLRQVAARRISLGGRR